METRVASWSRSDALNALAWMVDAGVDVIVSDAPAAWLRAPESDVPAMPVQPTQEIEKNPEKSNTSLASATHRQLVSNAISPLVVEGPEDAEIALIFDCDPRAGRGRILSDDESRLLERMMAAIGLDLQKLIRFGLTGALPTEHDMMAAPRRAILLLGNGPSQALVRKPLAQARGVTHMIEPANIPAITTFSPHALIQQPGMKSLAWADLRLFAKTIAR